MLLSLLIGLCFSHGLVLADFGHEDPANNKMPNWDFENNFGWGNWRGESCTLEHYTDDFYTGAKSGLVSNRDSSIDAAKGRYNNPKIGTYYYFSMFVKFLDDNPADPDKDFAVKLMTKFKITATNELQFGTIGVINQARKSDEWFHVGGDFKTPDEAAKFVEFYILDAPAGVRYLLDSSSLVELDVTTNWRQDVDANIELNRKNDVTLSGMIPPQYDPSLIEIKVTQTRHEFAIGSSVVAAPMVDTDDFSANYKQFVFDNYEWIVFENAMKWRQMESKQGVQKHNTTNAAVAVLKDHSIKVRGHAPLWDIEEYNPNWVQALSGEALRTACNDRIDFAVSHYKDSVEHWDVYNERIPGDFYENEIGDRDYMIEAFNRVAAVDPNVKLFLNEYLIMRGNGLYASDMGNVARYLQDNGVSLHGLGIQSHHQDDVVPMQVLQKRFDILSNVNLPIWITELSVHRDDVNERAAILDDVMRLYFSQDNVDGILLWGFSDQYVFQDDMALAEGTNLELNAAGLVWDNLVHNEWTTNESCSPTSSIVDHTFSGFHGDYKVEVFFNSVKFCEQEFSLPKGQDKDVLVKFCHNTC